MYSNIPVTIERLGFETSWKTSLAVLTVPDMNSSAASLAFLTSRIRRLGVLAAPFESGVRPLNFGPSGWLFGPGGFASAAWNALDRCARNTESVSVSGRESNRCSVRAVAHVSFRNISVGPFNNVRWSYLCWYFG